VFNIGELRGKLWSREYALGRGWVGY